MDGQEVMIGGLVTARTIKATKNNKLMAFLTVEDLYGSVEVLVFPNTYERYKDLTVEDAKVFIRGRVSAEEEADSKLIASVIFRMDDLRPLWLRLPDKRSWDKEKEAICQILENDPGEKEVRIYLTEGKIRLKAPDRYKTSASDETVLALQKLLGTENVG